MSAIDDFECDAAGCEADAGELIATDSDERVLLCARCHQMAYDAGGAVTLASGDVLLWGIATGWYLLPEPVEERR